MTHSEITFTKIAKAMSHPTRERALRILNERVASPSDIAQELQLSIATVSFHVKTLLQLGCIEEVETRVVRGAIEHRYRAVVRPFLQREDWERLPGNARRSVEQAIIGSLLDDISGSAEAAVFDTRSNRHLSRTPLRLDEQAWDEIADELLAVLERAIAKQGEAAARLEAGGTGGGEIASVLGILHFPAAPPAAA